MKDGWQLLEGDALALLTTLEARSVDAVVTDPPYGLGLRGADWDTPKPRGSRAGKSTADAFERWNREWAAECLRVLKPGGYLLAFGAPRTVHRLAGGVEDAGFQLQDQLLWLYGSGVPKRGLTRGRSSTLKPAYEPILLARAPLEGGLDSNELRWGTGRLGIDEARLPAADRAHGRWPCNLALSHGNRCRKGGCAQGCPVRLLDRSRPALRPSRFFYCSKPSRGEREAGCEQLPARAVRIYGGGGAAARRNTHPTVKPVALMRWLVRLACPPGALVLDPFAGSGSTGIAALAEGRRFLGIERDPDYLRIARARLEHAAHNLTHGAAGRDGGTVDARPGSGPRVRRTAIHLSKGGTER